MERLPFLEGLAYIVKRLPAREAATALAHLQVRPIFMSACLYLPRRFISLPCCPFRLQGSGALRLSVSRLCRALLWADKHVKSFLLVPSNACQPCTSQVCIKWHSFAFCLSRLVTRPCADQAAVARHAPAREESSWEPYWQLAGDLEARADKARAPKSALRPASGRKPAGRKCAIAESKTVVYVEILRNIVRLIMRTLCASHSASRPPLCLKWGSVADA